MLEPDGLSIAAAALFLGPGVLLVGSGCQPARPAASAEMPSVSGRLGRVERKGGLAEVPDTVLVVDLVNQGREDCTVAAYEVGWGSGLLAGAKQCRPAVAQLPAGATVQDQCVVQSRTQLGATPGLDEASVRVTILEGSCAPSRGGLP